MCWECYSCVKACPHHAIDVRGYADFAPLGHSVRVDRDEEKGTIAWRIKFRNGKKDMELLAPITTKPWGTAIPKLADVPGPSKEMRDSELLFNEPKYIRMDDGGLHTLKSNGLNLKKGCTTNGLKTIIEDDIDILVVGAGLGGTGAAFEARYWGKDKKIVIAEKANIDRSGAVAQGLYAINCYMGTRFGENNPEDHVRYARIDLMGMVREDLAV